MADHDHVEGPFFHGTGATFEDKGFAGNVTRSYPTRYPMVVVREVEGGRANRRRSCRAGSTTWPGSGSGRST